MGNIIRVGTDLDGVNDNFGEGVRLTLEATGQGNLWKSGPTEHVWWDYYQDWGWTFAQFKELCDYGVDKGIIFSGHFRPGAIEAMQRICDTGSKVIVLTDRKFGSDPLNSQKNTYAGFKKYGFPYDEVHFTSDKTSVHVDMMNDDKTENYQALVAAGTPTWLIDQQWNQSLGDVPTRIKDVSAYADIVDHLVETRTDPKKYYADIVENWAKGRPTNETEPFVRPLFTSV